MLDALSPQRRRLVLGVGILATVVALVVTVSALVRAQTDPAVPQDQPGPVLLVPGYGGRGASLTPLVDALTAAGRRAVVVEPVGNGTGDLRIEARNLDQVARQVRDDTGAASVDVIGYSAGGVVARWWVRAEGGDTVARRVLTLGSPQHGTSQAALGAQLAGSCPPACQQLAPDSDLLRQLNAGDETPDGPAWVTVRTTGDQVVTPVTSAALEGALNLVVQDVCPGASATHGDLTSHPVVLAVLSSVLGPGAPAAPAGVRC